jgi:CheY-like chemotaxis protein
MVPNRGATLSQARILVVEDEAVVAMSECFVLESLGYQVTSSVASGEQAIAAAERERPDLVLMDVRLQGRMSGLEAAHEIHRRFGIPIVFVTANDGDELDLADLPSPGARIPKPFTDEQLERTLRQTLGGTETF